MRTSAARAGIAVGVAVGLMSPLGVGTSSAYAGPVPKCHGLVATLVGTQRNDHLMGTPRRDVIVGLRGRDVIRGGGGADVVCGGKDSDRLFGGPGDDRLYGEKNDSATEQLDGGPGDDLLDQGLASSNYDRFSFSSARRGVTVDLARHRARGEGHDRLVFHHGERSRTGLVTVVGSRHDDVIYGDKYGDQLYGGAGNDRLVGRGGGDILSGEFGLRSRSRNLDSTDVLDGGPGPDDLRAAHGADVVLGRGGADLIFVRSHGVSARGNDGDDYVHVGLSVRDVDLRGGDGLDHMTATAGNPPGGTSFVSFAFDQASGSGVVTLTDGTTWPEHFGGFDNYFMTGALDWIFEGDDESTVLSVDGTSLDAHMGPGDDSVRGTPNHDVLDGGDGTDSVSGSGGADECTNFEAGTCP